MEKWQFPERKRSNAEQSDDSLLPGDQLSSRHNSTPTPRRVSFFDVGGLLDDQPSLAGTTITGASISSRRDSHHSGLDPLSPHVAPSPTLTASSTGVRRGSTALLQDLSGLLAPANTKPVRTRSKTGTELQPIPQSQQELPEDGESPTEPTLMDRGGLLK